MKTQWKIVAFDETIYWSEEMQAKAGRLYGIYLFDANRHTYCCEITPSYELYRIETVWTRNTQDEALQMDVLDGDATGSDDVVYYHCRVIDRMRPQWFEAFPKFDEECETDEEWKDQLEEMLEYLRGNSHCPPGVPFIADQEQA